MREKAGVQDSIIHGLKCSLKKLGYSLLCKQWNPLKGVKAWKAMQFRKSLVSCWRMHRGVKNG